MKCEPATLSDKAFHWTMKRNFTKLLKAPFHSWSKSVNRNRFLQHKEFIVIINVPFSLFSFFVWNVVSSKLFDIVIHGINLWSKNMFSWKCGAEWKHSQNQKAWNACKRKLWKTFQTTIPCFALIFSFKYFAIKNKVQIKTKNSKEIGEIPFQKIKCNNFLSLTLVFFQNINKMNMKHKEIKKN